MGRLMDVQSSSYKDGANDVKNRRPIHVQNRSNKDGTNQVKNERLMDVYIWSWTFRSKKHVFWT